MPRKAFWMSHLQELIAGCYGPSPPQNPCMEALTPNYDGLKGGGEALGDQDEVKSGVEPA